MMNNNYEDIPKYRKKKESSISKSNFKSKHKHDYSKKCMLITTDNNYPYHATYCSICGKIENVRFFEAVREDENGYYRMLDTDEVYEKHKNLEKIYVDQLPRS